MGLMDSYLAALNNRANVSPAEVLLEAAQCLEKQQKTGDARVLLMRALAIADRPAWVGLELAKRGYLK